MIYPKMLMCRKPNAVLTFSECGHWPFMECRNVGALRYYLNCIHATREALKEPYKGWCKECKEVVNALPSYLDLEAKDRMLYPDAEPCDCACK